jgi:hypothetical protein
MSGAALAGPMRAMTLLRDGGTIKSLVIQTTADHSCVTKVFGQMVDQQQFKQYERFILEMQARLVGCSRRDRTIE